MDRAEDHRQGLVDKDEDEGDLGEVPGVADLSASGQGNTNTPPASVKQDPFIQLDACESCILGFARSSRPRPLLEKSKLPPWSC